LQVDRPKVRSEGEMFSRAGFAGLIMALLSMQPLTQSLRPSRYPLWARPGCLPRLYPIRLPIDVSSRYIQRSSEITKPQSSFGEGRSRCAHVLSPSNLHSLDCSHRAHSMAMNCEREWAQSLDLFAPSHFLFSTHNFVE